MPAVACFDTAFHATLPDAAATYALPAAWRERWRVRRYGFHGLSHAWIARARAEMLGVGRCRPADRQLPSRRRRVAVRDRGRALGRHHDGVHAARGPGDGDPLGQRRPRAAAVAAGARRGMSERELAGALEHESGLLGLAGSADMRDVLAGAAGGDQRARLALDVYLHRLRGRDRVDGRGARRARRRSCSPAASGSTRPRSAAEQLPVCGFLGVAVDEPANAGGERDRDISARSARRADARRREPARTWRSPTRLAASWTPRVQP